MEKDMTDQEILDNAPKGATHWNECNYMRYNPNSGGWHFYDKTTSEWLYTYTNDLANLAIAGDIRSLDDIRRIVELEKDRDIRDLEQQAKGLEDFAQSLMFRGCLENSFNKYDADEAAIDLRTQAKALKEQVTL